MTEELKLIECVFCGKVSNTGPDHWCLVEIGCHSFKIATDNAAQGTKSHKTRGQIFIPTVCVRKYDSYFTFDQI